MPGSALRPARGTFRAHPARRPISALPAPLLAYRSSDMCAPLARQARAGWDLTDRSWRLELGRRSGDFRPNLRSATLGQAVHPGLGPVLRRDQVVGGGQLQARYRAGARLEVGVERALEMTCHLRAVE